MTWAIPPLRPGRAPEAPRRQPESRDQGHEPPADQEVAEVAGRERVGAAERLVVDLTHRAPLSAAYGTAAWGAGDAALIRRRARRVRSAPMQSASAAARTTCESITTIVYASGTPAGAKDRWAGDLLCSNT